MMKENDRLSEELSTQLQADLQSIVKEVDLVNMEFSNRLRNAESVCDGKKESTNANKSQADASVNSLRLENDQNTEKVNNKVGEITLEIRSVTSSSDECNIRIQTDKQIFQIRNPEIKFRVWKCKNKNE